MAADIRDRNAQTDNRVSIKDKGADFMAQLQQTLKKRRNRNSLKRVYNNLEAKTDVGSEETDF